MNFSGRVWRHIPAEAHPLNARYILKAGGRWNRSGIYGCLYTALSIEGAMGEFRKLAAAAGIKLGDLKPRDLVSLNVTVDPVLDLTKSEVRSRLGITYFNLISSDPRDIEVCRAIADQAREEGYRAILAPSAAEVGERTLTIYWEGKAEQLDIDTGTDRLQINYGSNPLLRPEELHPAVIEYVSEDYLDAREEICRIFSETYVPDNWNDWRWQMRHRLSRLDQFEKLFQLTDAERRGLILACEKFSVAITPHFASLIDPLDPDCPIRLQVMPQDAELIVGEGEMADPCGEDSDTVVEGLVHRYPDRVLFLVLDTCAAYCRYCTRSRLVSQGELEPLGRRVENVLAYLKKHTEVRDVLLSGGDPLLMSDATLDQLLNRLRAIPHIEFIRLGTRIPSFLPQRITPNLVQVLRKYQVWLSVHFCHIREITPEVTEACDRLADGGIPLGCETVLLRGVNDSDEALRDLFQGLLKIRVRPYYLYQCDPVVGTSHMRTPISKGLELMSKLRGRTTGYAIPTFVVDAPSGGGKVPLQFETLLGREDGLWRLRNWEGKIYTYPDPAE